VTSRDRWMFLVIGVGAVVGVLISLADGGSVDGALWGAVVSYIIVLSLWWAVLRDKAEERWPQ